MLALGCGGETEGTGGFVGQLAQNQTDKIDILFMIDSSLGMGDKQLFLQQAVPRFMARLVDPNCIDTAGFVVAKAGGVCPAGSRLEFTPIQDIHIGIVTSSLGGGGKPCAPGSAVTPLQDDHGHLIGSLRGGLAASGLGFLAWDPQGTGAQAGGGQVIADAAALGTTFTEMIQAVGEQGCGYESGLEGWYRFLVDPQPPAAIILEEGATTAVDVDQTVLEQRQQFLRPDSLVAIIMLSDENDCSIIDHGPGWLTAVETRLPRATSQCDENPNDKCCFSCKQDLAAVPAGCPGPVGSQSPDPKCNEDAFEGYGPGFLSAVDDQAGLRCWQTKRRFGLDLLFPTARYVDGLTKTEICGREIDSRGICRTVANPLMSASPSYPALSFRTDSSSIYLAGIVGVPWQDIASEATLDPNVQALEYMDFQTLTIEGRWDLIVGDANGTATSPPVPPADPFMIESVDERGGENPITGQPIVPSSSTDPHATINGHEVNASAVSQRDGLQYACIFDLPNDMQRDCTLEEYTTQDPARKKGCDCKPGMEGRNRPLCSGNVQVAAKAYPGLRYLQVLKDFGIASQSSGSIVASACPKFAGGDAANPAYGYNPALDAIIHRLAEQLKGPCLARALPLDDQGRIACQVVEVTEFGKTATPSCDSPGRSALPDGLEAIVLKQLQETGRCGDAPRFACRAGEGGVNMCLLTPAQGSDYDRCLMDATPAVTGYCYIDALQDANQNGNSGCVNPDGTSTGDESAAFTDGGDCVGNPDLVMHCAPSMKRWLRFVSPEDARVPAKNSTLVLVCER